MSDSAGRVSLGTIRDLWDKTSGYANTGGERSLLDLVFRTAFGVHPDYWSDVEVGVADVSAPARVMIEGWCIDSAEVTDLEVVLFSEEAREVPGD